MVSVSSTRKFRQGDEIAINNVSCNGKNYIYILTKDKLYEYEILMTDDNIYYLNNNQMIKTDGNNMYYYDNDKSFATFTQ
jgi:hypothetical protein